MTKKKPKRLRRAEARVAKARADLAYWEAELKEEQKRLQWKNREEYLLNRARDGGDR